MTREAYERELGRLRDDVVRMGERAGAAVHRSVDALRARDVAVAERIIADDDAIDRLHLDLEERCMRLLATQQPTAGDLRAIASIFAITLDLERMADHAEGISRAVTRLGGEPPAEPQVELLEAFPAMDARLQEMLRDALAAFRAQDPDLARAAAAQDDVVDALRTAVLRELLDRMIADPRIVPRALELLIVARHLERAADHVTNVCERIVYMATGELRELNV